jgi:hypothetical protein
VRKGAVTVEAPQLLYVVGNVASNSLSTGNIVAGLIR